MLMKRMYKANILWWRLLTVFQTKLNHCIRNSLNFYIQSLSNELLITSYQNETRLWAISCDKTLGDHPWQDSWTAAMTGRDLRIVAISNLEAILWRGSGAGILNFSASAQRMGNHSILVPDLYKMPGSSLGHTMAW